MAFPSNTGSVPYTLEAGLSVAMRMAGDIKAQAQALLSGAQSGGVFGNSIVAFAAFLASDLTQFNVIASLSGIGSYAQSQIGSATENITTDFQNLTAAITNTINWITGNFPKDANGNVLYQQFNADGTSKYTLFTPAQLTGFATQLNALIATIN